MPFNPGSINNILPRNENSLWQEIDVLRREITELRTARTGNAMTIDGMPGIVVVGGGGVTVKDDGCVTIRDGGQLFLLDDEEKLVAMLGRDTTGPALVTYRSDGTVGLDARNDFTGIRDHAGNPVVSDDATSGVGLATPWVPLTGLQNTNTGTWPATTNSAWTSIAASYVRRQNPGIIWQIMTQADTSTSGKFRLTIDGTTIATSPTVTGAFALWTGGYFWPDGWVFNSYASVSLDAEVTSGTGTIRANCYELTGRQSP